jgi:hypothetical protein
MKPTPEQIQRLLSDLEAHDLELMAVSFRALSSILQEIDGGTYNPNLNFGGWLPVKTAPKDGAKFLRLAGVTEKLERHNIAKLFTSKMIILYLILMTITRNI